MTREEAIIELKEDIALYMPKEWVEEIDRDTSDGRLITALEMAIKVLERDRWIPVDERLPEPWESVLITFSGKHGNITADHAVGLGSWDGSLNGWYFDEIEGYTEHLTVEAWMPVPLPEPYKEG